MALYNTKQEVFDAVVKHLLTQGQQSIDKNGWNCLYRNDNGLKCAIGALIPDSMYKSSMENVPVAVLISNGEIPELFDESIPAVFLRQLQNIHDLKHPSQWKKSLEEFATVYILNLLATTETERPKATPSEPSDPCGHKDDGNDYG